MTAYRLAASGLRLRLGHRQVLDGIDLVVGPGEVTAVMGPSGAGKTSLLMVLANILEPDDGSVSYEEVVSAGDPTSGDRRHGPLIGFVPQTLGLSPTLSAAENVAIVLQVHGLGSTEMRERVESSLGSVGLAAEADRVVTELSGGQRQRVAVARALALRPDVIIADEATAELDGENQRRVTELMQAEADRGAAIVLATHDPEVASGCTMAFQLSGGQLDALEPDPEETDRTAGGR